MRSETLHICHEGLRQVLLKNNHVYENCWSLLINMEHVAPFLIVSVMLGFILGRFML
jgi:hypothetical protein